MQQNAFQVDSGVADTAIFMTPANRTWSMTSINTPVGELSSEISTAELSGFSMDCILDQLPHLIQLDATIVHPDLPVDVDAYQNITCGFCPRRFCHRPFGVDASFLDEGRRHDKENQHDEHDIEHRRDIDIHVFFALSSS
jgi:hypothetical protein